MSRTVSAAALKRMSSATALFWRAITTIGGGADQDNMEIANGRQAVQAIGKRLEPRVRLALRTVSVAAAIEGDAGHAAILATLDRVRRAPALGAPKTAAMTLRWSWDSRLPLASARGGAMATEDVRRL